MAKKTSTQQPVNEMAPTFFQNNTEVKKIACCLGVLAVRHAHHRFKADKDRIPFLAGIGFDRHEIAAILNTTPSSVSVVLTNLKKKDKKPKGQPKTNGEDQTATT